MRLLVQNQYLSITIDETHDLLHFQRQKARFPSAEEAEKVFVEALGLAQQFEPLPHNLLMDFRDAPLRNDDAFEGMLTRIKNKLDEFYGHFIKKAMLVRTAAGILQVGRLRRERGTQSGELFQDEARALAYLNGQAR